MGDKNSVTRQFVGVYIQTKIIVKNVVIIAVSLADPFTRVRMLYAPVKGTRLSRILGNLD